MSKDDKGEDFMQKLDKSAVLTVLGIILLFCGAVFVTLIAPGYIDTTWVQPTSDYQVQMYEVSDPNIYISSLRSRSSELQSVYHLKQGYSLLAFQEAEFVKIISPRELEKYITGYKDPQLKLTSRLLLLRDPQKPAGQDSYNAVQAAEEKHAALLKEWEDNHPDWKKQGLERPAFDILELYEHPEKEAFAVAPTDRIVENWVDQNFEILGDGFSQPWHNSGGVIYVNNPTEYRVKFYTFAGEEEWTYDPHGERIPDVEKLKSHPLGFRSRKELISLGEHIYAIEGCWYCHTDQTRTLVQDVVLNGSEAYPAPPSSANEYIYEKITFPGTRRIGPDLSRVGVKRPSRDWHQSHFWSPKTASKGSIMPAFQHLFDYDPRGTGKKVSGIPNFQFEALFQYLMTKGTRITPPNQAWWLGKDPVNTKEIIEGEKKL